MKIDFVGSSLVGGGAERVMVTLADTFIKKGHDVGIITFNDPDDFELSKGIRRVKLHNGRLKNHTLRSMLSLFIYFFKKHNRSDVVVSFIASTNLISIIVCKILGIKVIACEHTNHLSVTSKVVKYTREYFYRFADVITVLTSFDVSYYKKHKSKARIMPNPSSFEKYSKDTVNRNNVILAVGSLNRYKEKGFDNLLYIVEPILKANPSWIVKIVGGGDKGAESLKKIAKELNISKQLQLTGFRSDVSKIMQKSKIFVLPSHNEGLPMVLIEAMSQGLACISYNCISGPSDLIDHEFNGLLIEDQNKEEMRKAINLLIYNTDFRDNLRANALSNIDKYSTDNIYLKWKELFNEFNL